MANTDYQSQVTQLYNKLVSIDSTLSKLALNATVNTVQTSLMASLNSLLVQVDTLTTELQKVELLMTELLAEIRSK